jgi:hypothetical protein
MSGSGDPSAHIVYIRLPAQGQNPRGHNGHHVKLQMHRFSINDVGKLT